MKVSSAVWKMSSTGQKISIIFCDFEVWAQTIVSKILKRTFSDILRRTKSKLLTKYCVNLSANAIQNVEWFAARWSLHKQLINYFKYHVTWPSIVGHLSFLFTSLSDGHTASSQISKIRTENFDSCCLTSIYILRSIVSLTILFDVVERRGVELRFASLLLLDFDLLFHQRTFFSFECLHFTMSAFSEYR